MHEQKWQLIFSETANKQLAKLGHDIRKKIIRYLENQVLQQPDPHVFGKPLMGNLSGYWRYRVGDYRLICEFINNELTILVIEVGHRSKIYD